VLIADGESTSDVTAAAKTVNGDSVNPAFKVRDRPLGHATRPGVLTNR
jgi:hypothetical protein